MVKFSIITVCLNSERTIERCLDSLRNQTYDNYEHIIIDGFSSDRTIEIIKKFNFSKLISEKDEGIYYAMNKGAKLAIGSYILFLNSDDELHKDYLLECERNIQAFDFLSVGVNLISDRKVNKWIPMQSDISSDFSWRMPLPHAGLVVKTELFKSLGGFDEKLKIAADYDFLIRLLKNTSNGITINKVLVNFFVGGVSNNKSIIAENFKVRSKNFRNHSFRLYTAYILDTLRWIRNVKYQ